jgi:hypothetical protein
MYILLPQADISNPLWGMIIKTGLYHLAKTGLWLCFYRTPYSPEKPQKVQYLWLRTVDISTIFIAY